MSEEGQRARGEYVNTNCFVSELIRVFSREKGVIWKKRGDRKLVCFKRLQLNNEHKQLVEQKALTFCSNSCNVAFQ